MEECIDSASFGFRPLFAWPAAVKFTSTTLFRVLFVCGLAYQFAVMIVNTTHDRSDNLLGGQFSMTVVAFFVIMLQTLALATFFDRRLLVQLLHTFEFGYLVLNICLGIACIIIFIVLDKNNDEQRVIKLLGALQFALLHLVVVSLDAAPAMPWSRRQFLLVIMTLLISWLMLQDIVIGRYGAVLSCVSKDLCIDWRQAYRTTFANLAIFYFKFFVTGFLAAGRRRMLIKLPVELRSELSVTQSAADHEYNTPASDTVMRMPLVSSAS